MGRWTGGGYGLTNIIGWVFVGLVVMAQLTRAYSFYSYHNADGARRIVAGIQLAKGNGLVEKYADPTDLSKDIYLPLTAWPPAYSICTAIGYTIIPQPFIIDRILGGISYGLLFLGVYALFVRMGVDSDKSLAFLSFAGWMMVSFTPFHFMYFDEVFALALLVWGGYFLLRPTAKGCLLGFGCLAVAVLFRYAYLPFLLLPVLARGSTLIRYVFPSNTDAPIHWHKSSALFFLFLFIILLLLISIASFSPTLGDGSSYSFSISNGLNWNHLSYIDIFPIKSLAYISEDRLTNGLTQYLFIPSQSAQLIIAVGACLLFIIVILPPKQKTEWYQGMIMIIGTNILFLLLLSLFLAPEYHDDQFLWTYVMETRYFAPSILCLQLLLCLNSFAYEIARWRKWVLRAVWVSACCFGILHSGFKYGSLWKRGVRANESGFASEQVRYQQEKHLSGIYERVKEETEEGERVVWIYGTDVMEDAEGRIAAVGGAALLDWNNVKDSLSYSRPVKVYISLSDRHLASFKERLSAGSVSWSEGKCISSEVGDIWEFRLMER